MATLVKRFPLLALVLLAIIACTKPPAPSEDHRTGGTFPNHPGQLASLTDPITGFPSSIDDSGALKTSAQLILGPDSQVIVNGIDPSSVGTEDAAAPTRGDLIAYRRADGTLVLASLANPVPVAGLVTIANDAASPVPVTGTTTANIGTPGGLALDNTLQGSVKLAAPVLLNQTYSNALGILSDAGAHLTTLCVTNRDTTNAADYVILYNSTAVAGVDAGGVMTLPLPVSTSSQLGFACFGNDVFHLGGLNFATGVSYCYSTVPHFCTPGTAGNVDVNATGYVP